MKSDNRQLKILIATGIYPPDIGGPATMLGALANGLEQGGLGVKIITYSDNAGGQDNGRVFRISRQRNKIFRYGKYFWRMWRLAQWADLIYATDTYSVGHFARLIKKLTGKKYIVRFAGDSAWETAAANGWTKDYIVDFEDKKQEACSEKLKKRRRRILKNADAVIAVSNFMAMLAAKIGVDNKKISMIYNAVDFFKNLPARQESLVPTLVFAGRLVPWKNQVVILRVLAKLKIKYPAIVFEILGDGPEEGRLKIESERLKVAENVIFRGRVSEEESHKIFSRATIFILNTNYEGLSHAILNAMRVGVPVITTSVGGNVELITDGENGLLVPYDNEEEWQAAIEKLLDNPAWREKLSVNAKKSLEKFKFEEMAGKTIEMINNLV